MGNVRVARDVIWRRVSVSCAEEGEEVKRKFYDGQRVRVIGVDWTFRAWYWPRFGPAVWCNVGDGGDCVARWPEYLLESAE